MENYYSYLYIDRLIFFEIIVNREETYVRIPLRKFFFQKGICLTLPRLHIAETPNAI